MTDHRYLARPRDIEVHRNRLSGAVIIFDENGDEFEHTIPIVWEVCPTCEGRGTYVNPDIDSHGLSREDFDADPDFLDDYMEGRYDITCRECGGEKVVPEPAPHSEVGKLWLSQEGERARDRAEDAYTMRMENGGRD